MSWMMIVMIATGLGNSDLKIVNGLTEAQCKITVRMMHEAQANVAVLCVGPAGETFSPRNITED
jgi:aldehyde:ferredoxin oxidoreductase